MSIIITAIIIASANTFSPKFVSRWNVKLFFPRAATNTSSYPDPAHHHHHCYHRHHHHHIHRHQEFPCERLRWESLASDSKVCVSESLECGVLSVALRIHWRGEACIERSFHQTLSSSSSSPSSSLSISGAWCSINRRGSFFQRTNFQRNHRQWIPRRGFSGQDIQGQGHHHSAHFQAWRLLFDFVWWQL